MKKLAVLAALMLIALSAMPAAAGGIDDPPGNPLYVIIEVTWDGNPSHAGSWTVGGPSGNRR